MKVPTLKSVETYLMILVKSIKMGTLILGLLNKFPDFFRIGTFRYVSRHFLYGHIDTMIIK